MKMSNIGDDQDLGYTNSQKLPVFNLSKVMILNPQDLKSSFFTIIITCQSHIIYVPQKNKTQGISENLSTLQTKKVEMIPKWQKTVKGKVTRPNWARKLRDLDMGNGCCEHEKKVFDVHCQPRAPWTTLCPGWSQPMQRADTVGWAKDGWRCKGCGKPMAKDWIRGIREKHHLPTPWKRVIWVRKGYFYPLYTEMFWQKGVKCIAYPMIEEI